MTRRRSRGLLVVVLALLVVEAYWPFAWDPPRTVSNDVRRAGDGALVFGERNAARTSTTPAWLAEVRRDEQIQLRLVARPSFPEQYDPAATLMMLADGRSHADFRLGQQGRNLLFWLRRTGSSADGSPPFVVGDTFRPGHATELVVAVGHDTVRVAVDGATELDTPLRPGSLRGWSSGLLMLGDELDGGRGWHGEISRATVTVGRHTVDYLRPGALQLPPRFPYRPDHMSSLLPTSDIQWFALVLHLGSFVPVGFLLVRGSRRSGSRSRQVLVAVGTALGIAVALAAGKLLFEYRHIAAADFGVQVAGAVIGAYLAVGLRDRPPAEEVV